MILKVGLTGGIASGKSTVARMLAQLGCHVVDADAIVSEIYRPGAAGHQAIVAQYGRGILLPDGAIDRPQLARLALANDASAQRLNALIHPLVREEEERLLSIETRKSGEDGAIWVVEATLLLEAGGRDRYDRIVVVDVPPGIQLQRAIGRGLSSEEASRRIARQMSREERLKLADSVIENSSDREALELKTRELFMQLRADLDNATRPAK